MALPAWGHVTDGHATQDYAQGIHLWLGHPLLGVMAPGQALS